MNNRANISNWSIDQVLNPDSKFWDKMLEDMEMYLSTLDNGAISKLGREPFQSRISDFITFFKDKAQQQQIVEEIEKAEDVVTNALWSLINDDDKHVLFENDIEYFSDWVDSCPRELLDIYIKALSRGESLNEISKTDYDLSEIIRHANVREDMCNVSVFDGNLILCSTNKELLDKFKIVMVESGNKLREYRSDKNKDDLTLHTYIFEVKQNTDE
tara:strand:+ start:37 stop:681 length:645 start_codon:yes stop_codon:yes gene_type:complete